ncbi:hypothetical protein [Methanorbis furvi]|uniref:Uncharacterized protein n=1 Tax=Methanorbis furvi TaxID=3028299 RepID=A0AAE4S9X0_9EURY|nr:hypothetical protein [Methanocorpusculaceae archaeon Ag1]
MNAEKYFSICLLLFVVLATFTAGCIQLPDRGDAYLKNISEYVIIQADRLNVTLSDEEINRIADEIAEKYADTYNTKREGWYSIDHNDLHITIGRAFGLSNREITSYIEEINRRDAIAYHHPPVTG